MSDLLSHKPKGSADIDVTGVMHVSVQDKFTRDSNQIINNNEKGRPPQSELDACIVDFIRTPPESKMEN